MRATSLSFVLLAAVIAGCPEEASTEAASNATFELPDRYHGRASVLALRLTDVNTTDPVVHDDLSELLTDQLSLMDVVQRGYAGGDIVALADTSEEGLSEAFRGTAIDQALAMWTRVVGEGEAVYDTPPTDACGNPVVAAFVTPNNLQAIQKATGVGEQLYEQLRATASTRGDCTHGCEGVMDAVLTQVRGDGSVDAILSVYPEIRDTNPESWNPGWMGQLVALFSSRDNPGVWAMPFVTVMERVQVSVQSVLRQEYADNDPVFGDHQRLLVFPHGAREISRSHIGVSFLADDLCDTHYAAAFGDDLATPFGCQLESGMSFPTQLELNSAIGQQIYSDLLNNGEQTTPISQLSEVLSYTIGTQLACPTAEEDVWLQEGVVEAFLCTGDGSDAAFDACVARRDRDRYGCAMDDTSLFEPVERTMSSTGLTLAAGRTTYEVSAPEAGGKGGGTGVGTTLSSGTLTVEGPQDGEVLIYTPTPGKVTGGTTVDADDLWCTEDELGSLTAIRVGLNAQGRGTVTLDVSSPVTLMVGAADRTYLQ